MRPAGIVLCGGLSQRMGRPKALLPFAGQTLIERIVERVAPAAEPIVVVAAVDQDLPPLPARVSIVRDELPERGPLAGLMTGLKSLPPAVDAALVVGCDAPFVSPQVVAWLAARLGDNDAIVPRIAGIPQSLHAVYRRSVSPVAEELIASGRSAMRDLVARLSVRWVDEDELRSADSDLLSFVSFNDPAGYEAALYRLGERGA